DCTTSSDSLVASEISSGVGSRRSVCRRNSAVRTMRDRSAVRFNGTRTVRPWRANAARIAWRIHHTAYEMNFTPWSGSNFRAAVSSPTFPSPIRAVRGRPRFWYFLATEITKRRLRFTSSCIASWSPARTLRASAISSFWVSSGVLDTSWRYWSRMSRSCSWVARPASRPRRRPRFLAGFAFAWGAGGRAGAPAAAATARAAARGFARAGEVVFFRRMCLGMSIVPDHRIIPDTGRKVRVRAQKRLTPLEHPDKMPCSRRNAFRGAQYNGGVAQLGERVNGIHEVRGSIPLASTERAARAARGRQEAVHSTPLSG